MGTPTLKKCFYESALGLLRFAGRNKPLKLATLPMHHFGYSCSYAANLIAEVERVPSPRRPRFLFAKPKQVANQTIYELWSRRLSFSKLTVDLIEYIEESGRHKDLLHTWRKEPYFDTLGYAANTPPPVSFSKKERSKAHQQLRERGIDPDKPWVCLCVRELGYLSQKLGPDESSEHSYRQSSLSNFSMAVGFLLKSGFQVIKMGVATQGTLPEFAEVEDYFDYSQMNRSEFLDIYLVSGCSFYLGDSDGLVNVVRLFKRPYVIANWIPISLANTARENAIILFKELKSETRDRSLSIEEIVETGCNELLSSSHYNERGLYPEENTENEILSATKLMLERLEGSKHSEDCLSANMRSLLALREPLRAHLPQFASPTPLSAPSSDTLKTLQLHCRQGNLATASWLVKRKLTGLERRIWSSRINSLACQWNASDAGSPLVPSSLPLCYKPTNDSHHTAEQLQRYDLNITESAGTDFTSASDKANKDKLTIAYLSFDFRSHSAGIPLIPLLEKHSEEQFSVVALNLGSPLTPTPNFHLINLQELSVDEQISKISNHGIDLIINTSDHLPENCRKLLASITKIPVLAAWGYFPVFNKQINDAVLVDPVLAASIPKHSTLSVVEVPSVHLQSLSPSSSHVENSEAQATTPLRIGAFNNPYKLDSQVFDCWLSILEAVPNSILSLPESNPYAKRRLLRNAKRHGVSADRIEFLPRVPREEHLKRISTYRLLLDNPRMGAGGQIFDAIQACVPVLSFDQNLLFNRSGASILSALNLPAFLAKSLDQYQELALALLKDNLRHQDARKAILAQRSHYIDTLFDRHFTDYEQALVRYIRTSCSKTD